MEIFVILVGIFMMVATVLPFIRHEAWWIRAFDFPRLQITAITAVVFAAFIALADDFTTAETLFLVLLGMCLVYQIIRMLPYTSIWPQQVQKSRNGDPDNTLTLVFANVEMNNRKSERLKEILHEVKPDIFLALETDHWWKSELEEFSQEYQHTVFHCQENYYGMMLFSNLALKEPHIEFLIQDDIPSIHTHVQLPSGQEIALHCLHPRPPMPDPDSNPESTERDAELLIVGRQVKERQEPTIVMGDLNDVAWSHTNKIFQKISGLLDPRIGRGFYNSFHAQYPLIRFPLDHFFHSKHFRLVDFKRLPAFGSDHFPMFIELSFEPDASMEQHAEEADQEEEKEADEKIHQAKANNSRRRANQKK